MTLSHLHKYNNCLHTYISCSHIVMHMLPSLHCTNLFYTITFSLFMCSFYPYVHQFLSVHKFSFVHMYTINITTCLWLILFRIYRHYSLYLYLLGDYTSQNFILRHIWHFFIVYLLILLCTYTTFYTLCTHHHVHMYTK